MAVQERALLIDRTIAGHRDTSLNLKMFLSSHAPFSKHSVSSFLAAFGLEEFLPEAKSTPIPSTIKQYFDTSIKRWGIPILSLLAPKAALAPKWLLMHPMNSMATARVSICFVSLGSTVAVPLSSNSLNCEVKKKLAYFLVVTANGKLYFIVSTARYKIWNLFLSLICYSLNCFPSTFF